MQSSSLSSSTSSPKTKGNDGKGALARRFYQTSRPSAVVLVVVTVLVLIGTFSVNVPLRFDGEVFDYTDTSSSSSSLRASSQSQSSSPTYENAQQCQLFLAESAIPFAGLGAFTGRAVKKGETAQPHPDLCVYLTNVQSHKQEVDTHTWQDYRFGAQWEYATKDLEGSARAACQGVVTIFNSMSNGAYASARPKALPSLIGDHAQLHRQSSPGAGAISNYYGASSTALRDLQPGAELMLWDDSHDIHAKKSHTMEPHRTLPWLWQHGMCADNIVGQNAVDASRMGRGAFAVRSLRAGTLVAPAPLQMLTGKRYDFAVQTRQLILNYAFQFNTTDNDKILLYPYGPGVGLINHASSSSSFRLGGKKQQQNNHQPNVKIRWSTSTVSHSQWLDLPTIDEFLKMATAPGTMLIEYYAIRDIQQGEEIFLDYGPEWQAAWQTHVEHWQPPPQADQYVYPSDLNAKLRDSNSDFVLRTVKEQETNPYAPNLMTVCDTRNWDRDVETTLEWKASKKWPEELVECEVIARRGKRHEDDGEYYYDVALIFEPDQDAGTMNYVDTAVPQHAIRFVDKPGHSDQMLKNAFRHPMAFPTELIPPQWRS